MVVQCKQRRFWWGGPSGEEQVEIRDCTCTVIRRCDGYGNTLAKGAGFGGGQGEEEVVQVVAIWVVEAERGGPACGMPASEVRVP